MPKKRTRSEPAPPVDDASPPILQKPTASRVRNRVGKTGGPPKLEPMQNLEEWKPEPKVSMSKPRAAPKEKVSKPKAPKEKVSKPKAPKEKVTKPKAPKEKVSKPKAPKEKVTKKKNTKKTPQMPLPSVPEIVASISAATRSDMPLLLPHEPPSLLPTESHEFRVLEHPTQQPIFNVPIPANLGPVVAGPSHLDRLLLPKRTTRSVSSLFWKEHVQDWKYFSTSIPNVNYQDREEKTVLRNHFWHVVKTRTGSYLRVSLTEKAEGAVYKMTFDIIGFRNRRAAKSDEVLLASTTALAERGIRTQFVFKINDQESATSHRVTIQIMKIASESVFQTVIIRCMEADGRGVISADDMEKYLREREEELKKKAPRSRVCVTP